MKASIYVICYCVLILAFSQKSPEIKVKSSPEYPGVSIGLYPYVEDYIAIAKEKNLTFKHHITAGFKTINAGTVIGLCTYGEKFREIDIDSPFWDRAGFGQKRMLIFHELTHCLCGRGHDYAAGKDYPSNLISEFFSELAFRVPYTPPVKPGYFKDGCGISIMTPEIASEECVETHESEYLEEMLDRCQPY